jgi:glycosyltransferase involved in cell wall biosynthesis
VKNVMVVIPALNEEGSIASVVRGLRDRGFERIRVIDNGSSDDTAGRALRGGRCVSRTTPRLRERMPERHLETSVGH